MNPAIPIKRPKAPMVALCLLAAGPLGASAQAEAPSLSIHGFMTQAYGLTDGHDLNGLGPDGTADYRVAALQFRYAFDPDNGVVVQLSHERFGGSALNRVEPDVDLDWVFYEHRFDDYTVGRVGKVRMPIGIYNEIRDVGTLLPFYRPPSALYGEQLWTSETLDGLTLGRRFPVGAWEVTVDGFLGSWEFLQTDLATMAKVDAGYGANVWIQTPLEGLRVGGAIASYTARELINTPPGSEDAQVLEWASLDGRFGPVGARGEFQHVHFGEDEIGYHGTSESYYGELTADITDRFTLMGQAQWYDFAIDIPAWALSIDTNWDRDFALGGRFSLTPSLVLKLEGHRYRGYSIEDEVLMPGTNQRVNVNYGMLSLSASF